MTITKALESLLSGEDLGEQKTFDLIGQLMDGELSEAEKSALLVALRAKGESVAEIAGAARAMRQRAVAIPHEVSDVVDTCGTGGDGKSTFNISTAAALVAAACGVPIAKHGNRSISSRSGSADVLEELGVRLDLSPEESAQCLQQVGISFFFAPNLHPAMKEVMPVRKALGIRTLFNVLGPLTNPAGARRQVMGVFQESLVEPIAGVLARLGAEHALVVWGRDGLDEITTTGPTVVAEAREGEISTYQLTPERFGIETEDGSLLRGGSAADNAATMRQLFESGGSSNLAGQRVLNVVAVNAAAALLVGGRAESLETGFDQARSAISSGAAAEKLEALRAFGA